VQAVEDLFMKSPAVRSLVKAARSRSSARSMTGHRQGGMAAPGKNRRNPAARGSFPEKETEPFPEPIADGQDVAVVGFVGALGGNVVPVHSKPAFKDRPPRMGNAARCG